MILSLLSLALQLRGASLGVAPQQSAYALGADSAHDVGRARAAQADFERIRRNALPWESRGSDRCDRRVGRFCWWYDGTLPSFPPESDRITERRNALLDELDTQAARHPGDEWLAGMRVHYRIEAGRHAGADSAARGCHAAAWWCAVVAGYAAHAAGEGARADSLFAAGESLMPHEQLCRWRDIGPLLDGDARSRYEHLPCDERLALEHRYWLLSRPRLAAAANDWRNEFGTRRVQGTLAAQSRNPQPTPWGDDATELVLRYGWPTAWARVSPASSVPGADPTVIGHDPSPSFHFAPHERVVLDSLADASDDDWRLDDARSPSRFAPRGVRRVTLAAVQLARFRRGGATLLVASYAITDDSVRLSRPVLAASLQDGRTLQVDSGSTRSGALQLLLPAEPVVAGVEALDSATATLVRSRRVFASAMTPRLLSDLLIYHGSDEVPTSLEQAAARAIAGDSVRRGDPMGLYWETYGGVTADDTTGFSITLERMDGGLLSGLRHRFGIGDPDSPIRVHWTAPPTADGATSARAVSVDTAGLETGRYRITLTVTQSAAPSRIASREVVLAPP